MIFGALVAGMFALYQIWYQVKKTAQVEKEMEQYRRLLDKKEKSEENEKQHQEFVQIAMISSENVRRAG